MEGLFTVAIVIGFIAVLVIFIYDIWCARRMDSIFNSCNGYFGKIGAYMYANFKLVLFISGIGAIGSLVAFALNSLGAVKIPNFKFADSMALAGICAATFVFSFLYVKYFEKKLLRLGGEENFKQLKKLAWIAGNGVAFRGALGIFGAVTTLTFVAQADSFYDRTITVDGQTISVHNNGDGTFTDRDGNIYRK